LMRMRSRKSELMRALTIAELWGGTLKKQENVSLDMRREGEDAFV